MLRTVLLVAVSALALINAAPSAWAKEKTKAPVARTEQMAPADIESLLTRADAAYIVPDGQTPDYETSFALYSQAAELGDSYAMNRVGLMYDNGEFVAQDYDKSFEWFKRSAEAGFPAGMSNVAIMYESGDGTGQDYAEALRWYRQSAQGGYGYAMYALGNLYLAGTGVVEDHEEAAAWYQKAVDAGHAAAYWSMALRYLYGDGIAKDTQQAAELAYLALTNGVDVARTEFKKIGDAETSPNFRRGVQELLKRDGFYPGSIDGSFGPQTMRAVDAAFGTAL